jgi:protease I
VAIMTANEGVEQVALTRPWQAVSEAGGQAELLATKPGEVQAFDHVDKADRFPVDRTTDQASADDYEALVLPGGVVNADHLRMDRAAVRLAGDFARAGKPIAVICHGPWTLIEADLVKGRTMTSWPSLQTDLRNAGATWVDRVVVVDDGLVSSRKPDDLDAFCAAMLEQFAGASRDAGRSSGGMGGVPAGVRSKSLDEDAEKGPAPLGYGGKPGEPSPTSTEPDGRRASGEVVTGAKRR